MPLRAALRSVVEFALPPRCPICGATVDADNRFCPTCWQQLDFLAKPWCASCGLPLPFDPPDGSLCAICLVEPPVHDGVRAVVRYDERSSLIAMRLKYGARLGLARLIADHLQKFVTDDHAQSIIVPVPLHPTRLWRRGFNQSALIGRELARATGMCLDHGIIVRSKITPPLRGLNTSQRQRAVGSAFALAGDAQRRIGSKPVILVDDVYTSGATTNACARLLKSAGAQQVVVFCWARVIKDFGTG